MRLNSEFSLFATLLVAVALLAGCESKNDPYGRRPVSGTITFQGELLESGVIDFLPTGDGHGAGARAMIQVGKYAVPREQGLLPGQYRVVIVSPEENTTDPPVGPPGMQLPPPGIERIPAEYNIKSHVIVEVTAREDNQFDFKLE